MYTVDNQYKYELIVKNSRFITLIYKVNSVNDVMEFINKCRLEYPNATHYCYAYKILDYKKADDDGEPSGTAGMPILNVIDSNNLTNILIVVIRYFGGIKLGANGLIRAYTKSAANLVKEANLIELSSGYNITITFDYNRTKEIDYLLKNIKINSKEFSDKVIYNIDIPKLFLDSIINNHIEYVINKEILIQKEVNQ